jgi:sortase A
MNYSDVVSDIDTVNYEQLLEDAKEYNEKLKTVGNRFSPSEEMSELYNSCLNVDDTGMMGYIDIPAINVKLPICHGTDTDILDTAIGHMEGSSLPVGGEGTHCVLSGHRGLPSARLFTDIDQLVVGDTFMIHTLDETLTYEVDQILIVEPDEVEPLEIDPKMDYCTLVTCTPYGVNTQRLLVRGHRVEAQGDGIRVTADGFQIDTSLVATIVAVPLLIILMVIMLISTRESKDYKRKSKENENDVIDDYPEVDKWKNSD